MIEEKEVLYKIAKKLYELFVVNRNAMAVQLADGTYVTKYIKVTENDIYCMLIEGKAIGSYQQLYKSGFLKWICFDFDCKDKDEPNVEKLYQDCTKPLNNYLDEKGIYYINEFSGRRGIHTWIIFKDYVTKKDAYNLVQSIKKNVEWSYDETEYGLDEFPSTFSSKGNIVGKQVKIPLSKHKKGGYSYFFTNDYEKELLNDSFFEKQLSILNSIKLNSFDEIAEKLCISIDNPYTPFVRTYSIGTIDCKAQDVIQVLSKTEVYRALLDRVMHGEAVLKDWLVMLGTIGRIGDGYRLLKEIFKYCPTFSEEKTNDQIEKYGKKYFPATFAYLYNIYDLDMESEIDPAETGLQYLIRNLGLNVDVLEWNQNEISVLNDSLFTMLKEQNYLFSNDEVPVVSIWNDLKHMTIYDTNKIDRVIEDIKHGEEVDIDPRDFFVFERHESENKVRKMISLSAYDRVLTSHIALNVFYGLNRSLKSYSYNPNYISCDEMFFHWFTAWGNYLALIRKYIDVDLYSSMHVLTIDIKHFYDSIDFLGVYKLLQDKLSEDENKLFMFLIKYNEKLMRKINGKRKGVPQGPAYARMIAEVFLGTLLDKALDRFDKSRKEVFLYRYVDDIIVFYEPSLKGKYIYDVLESILERHGLEINKEKSRFYGEIGKLTERQKAELLRSDQFQYGLRVSEYSFLTEEQYINEKVNYLIKKKGGFNIADISFFFSKYSDDRAKRMYFFIFASDIFQCQMGRGSGYQLFYRFLFDNPDILEFCVKNELFDLVPYNTINFSCLLSIAFYSLRTDRIYSSLRKSFIDKFVRKIDIEDIIGGEDKSIILSLSQQEA